MEKNSFTLSSFAIPHPPLQGKPLGSSFPHAAEAPSASVRVPADGAAPPTAEPAATSAHPPSRAARSIPPELRAIARVVSDADPRQFPELLTGPGCHAPSARELERVTTEINDGVPLGRAEFRLFRAAYAECRQHLGGVSTAVMESGSRYGEILTLTTQIEALCGECRVGLPRLFPHLKEIHEFVLTLSDRNDKHTQQHHILHDKLLIALCDALTRGITAMELFREFQIEKKRTLAAAKPRNVIQKPTPASTSAATTTVATPVTMSMGLKEGVNAMAPLARSSSVPSHPESRCGEASALGMSTCADSGAPLLRPAVPRLCQDAVSTATAGAPAASTTTEDSLTSPHTPKEVSTLLQLIHSEHNRHNKTPAHMHTANDHSTSTSLTAPQSTLTSPVHQVRHTGAVGKLCSTDDVSDSGDDEEDEDDYEDEDASEMGDLDLFMDDALSLASRPMITATMPTGKTTRKQQRRAEQAKAKLAAHRALQTRFLLCEDPSFLGPVRQSLLPQPLLQTGPGDGVAASRQQGEPADISTGARHDSSKGWPARLSATYADASSKSGNTMTTFMLECAARRAEECKTRYDSSGDRGISLVVSSAALLATMPLDLAAAFASVNADLRVHYVHLEWCAEALRQEEALRFRVSDCLTDLTMSKIWSSQLGEGCAACSAEDFYAKVAVETFPSWTHEAVNCVIHYGRSGVISPFSLLRVLQVWGPLMLLDRNIASDLRSGVMNLRELYGAIWPVFARRPDATAGDYVVCLTEEPGEVRLVALRAARVRRASTGGTTAGVSGGVLSMGGGTVADTDTDATPGRSRLQSWAAQSVPFDISISTRRFTSHRWLQQRGTFMSLGSTTVTTGNAGAGLLSQLQVSGGGRTSASHRAPLAGNGFSAAGGPLNPSDPARRDLVTTSYRVSQSTGAWRIEGLSRESFETIADACAAFPTVLKRAVGHVYTGASDTASDSAGEGGEDGAGSSLHRAAASPQPLTTPTTATYSALHRSCFRNNAAYVRFLIECGASLTINSAVVDPSVSPDYCWTALLCAVNNPNSDPVDVVELLLQNGADVHYRDDAGCTALYYAIANGYARATAALLRHCPTLGTSATTCPLLIAIGAHHYHVCDRDIRRLAHVLPSHAMLHVVARYSHHYATLALAAHILQDKLNGIDREPRFWERQIVAYELQIASARASGDAGGMASLAAGGHQSRAGPRPMTELRTPEQQAELTADIREHTLLCLRHRLELASAVKVLYSRSYWASWQDWLAELSSTDAHGGEGGRGVAGDGSALLSTMHSLTATGRLQRSSFSGRRRGDRGGAGGDDEEDEDDENESSAKGFLSASQRKESGGEQHDNGDEPNSDDPADSETRHGTAAAATSATAAVTATKKSPTTSGADCGLIWYHPRDLRRCMDYGSSVLPTLKRAAHGTEVVIASSRDETATAALLKTLSDRPGGVLLSRKLQQQGARLEQARKSVADFGSDMIYLGNM